ncbi:major facilitator family transporter [Paenibacillus pasadenensis]|uniref:Major facilitator family transporter n=1 Tax=Paenibacillus pasadenensis TaxID=217090 RepID=A0A2N5NCF3_9BACL|nr:MFS transporter [Paenibacillus pasadenensis]PLT48029.1 major facilitator family transporter [Paenibacillus pasadenensis]
MEGAVQRQAGEKLIRILAFTLAISVMSATMFNVVLPEIAAEFTLSLSQVSWVSSAFLLVYAVGTVMYGKLADTYRLKNLLAFGLGLFALGSAIGLLSQQFETVLLGRIVQAAGAAVIPATAGIIPVRYFPPESRGRALGISMTGLALGSALGPAVAALLVSAVPWRWLFGMPLLTLLALPSYRKYLNETPGDARRLDWLGGGLLAGTVALLLLAIASQAWLPAAGCVLLFVLFVARIRSVPDPFIRPDLFRSRRYSLGLTIAFLATGIGYSLVFLSPQLLTHVNRIEPGWVGLALVPAAAVTAALGRKGGKLADQKGFSALFYLGSALVTACFLLLSTFAGLSAWLFSGMLIFGNVGQSFLYMALSNAISRTLPQEQAGVGMGLLAMLNFISGAIAAGVYGKVVDQGAVSQWNPLHHHAGAAVYSNLYLVLAVLHLGILTFYFMQMDRQRRSLQ